MESIYPPSNPPINPPPNQPPNQPILQQPYPPQMAYVPVAVPPQNPAAHPGRSFVYMGIIFAVVSLLFIPPLFGVIGIILGIMAKNKGENSLGLTTIILAAIFMVIGMILSYWVNVAMKEGQGFILGPLLYLL